MEKLKGLGFATLIGSMPHRDRENAIELVLKAAPEIPAWPQLSIYPNEQMMVQYLEGLPGLVREKSRVFVRTDANEFDAELLFFYEQYLAVDNGSLKVDDSSFRMGQETGATFHRFLDAVRNAGRTFRALKGQIVGPFTLLTGLKDQDGRALIYDERFLDIIPKLLGFKARWQIEFMQSFGVPVIIFVDEPGLAGFGSSALITVPAELALRVLGETVEAIHGAGGTAGIHVCANTDWLLAFNSNFDIINFDSYGYFDKFAIYRKEYRQFIAEGGNIAWGVVPTADVHAIGSETAESLVDRWKEQIRELVSGEIAIKEVIAHSLFTPSCGCGSLTEDCAVRVLDLVKGFCHILRKDG